VIEVKRWSDHVLLLLPMLRPVLPRALLRCCCSACRRHQVTIFVEPKVFQELVDAGRVVPITPSTPKPTLNASSSSSKPVDGNSSSSKQVDGNSSSSKQVDSSSSSSAVPQTSSSGNLTGMLISTAQAAQQQGLFPANSWAGPTRPGSSGSNVGTTTAMLTAGQAAAAGAVVGAGGAAAGVIKTWQQEQQQGGDQQGQQLQQIDSSKVAASDLIPEAVAQQLDLVVVLGGDGTVLWTCHIFGNR